MKSPSLLQSKLAALCVAFSSAAPLTVPATAGTINNPTGTTTAWTDTSGNRIANNSGYLLKVGSTFYWYGFDPVSHHVNCYKSTTLASASWIKITTGGFPMFSSGWHGRPAVIFNSSTNKYVMLCEFSSPVGRNGVEYLTSTSPEGTFTSVHKDDTVLPGVNMGDLGVFKDDDGQAYLTCTTDDGGNTNGTHKIVRLNSDYIGQSAVIKSWTVTSNRREAFHIVKRNTGVYVMFSSATAGWSSSETWYKTATSLGGTWSAWATVPTSPTSTNSFNTQHDFVFKINGTQGTAFIYAGDRWGHQLNPSDPSQVNNNAWFHLTFNSSGVPSINGDNSWTIDPVTGLVTH